jgi:ATP-dependent helicase/nuclease subunit A
MNQRTDYDEAQFDLSHHLIVEAGAGAGKTYCLTRRYVYALLQDACEPRQILTMTFTRKAAIEMRERVRTRIGECLALGHLPDEVGGAELTAEQFSHLCECREALSQAPINTFHGICSDLLRQFPVEAGVDPKFTLLEPAASQLRLERLVADVLERILQDQTHELHAVLLQLLADYDFSLIGKSIVHLRKQNLDLAQFPERACLEKTAADFFLDHPLLEAIWPANYPAEDDQAVAVSQAVADFRGEATLPNLFRIAGSTTLRGKAPWKEDFKQLRDLFLPDKMKKVDNQAEFEAKAATVLGLVLKLAVSDEFQHLSPAELDYNALEQCTLRMLEKPELGRRIRAHLDLRHVFVDEYQDTNDVQRRIIYYLLGCENPDAPAPQLPKSAPRLFAVGDPKQSIYRFRNAEVEVFARTRKDVTTSFGGKSLNLTRNYRSCPPLLDFFNHLFGESPNGEGNNGEGVFSRVRNSEPADYEPLYVDMLPGREVAESEKPTEPVVNCCLLKKKKGEQDAWESGSEEEDAPEEATSIQEANWIADQIQTLLQNGKFTLADMAILKYSVRSIDDLKRVFDCRGIRYFVVGTRGLTDCQEVRDILPWLQFLASPEDDLQLLCCAKQPWIGLSDADLLKLRLASAAEFRAADETLPPGLTVDDLAKGLTTRLRFLSLKDTGADGARINKALACLRGRLATLNDYAGRVSVAELAERIVELNRMRETWACRRLPAQPDNLLPAQLSVANLERFLLFLRQSCGTSADLPLALDVVEGISGSSEGSGEAQLAGETEDVVRIMTVHQAKGLEFPVVFAMGINSLGGSDRDSAVVKLTDGLPCVKLADPHKPTELNGTYQNMLSLAARQIGSLKNHAERRRLFYVAVTRAKERLYLSGSYSPASEPTKEMTRTIHNRHDAASWLWQRYGMDFDEGADRAAWPDAMNRWLGHGADEVAQIVAPESDDSIAAVLQPAQVMLLSPSWDLATMVNPSTYKSRGGAAPGFVLPKCSRTFEKKGAAVVWGDLFHQLMAVWDFDELTLETEIDRLLTATWGDDSALRQNGRDFLFHCVGNFQEMEWRGESLLEVFQQAEQQGRLYREWPFLLRRGEKDQAVQWINGTVDVVLEWNDTPYVFDYKTGKEPPAHYAPQMQLYKQALSEGLGQDVASPVLLYVEQAVEPDDGNHGA